MIYAKQSMCQNFYVLFSEVAFMFFLSLYCLSFHKKSYICHIIYVRSIKMLK